MRAGTDHQRQGIAHGRTRQEDTAHSRSRCVLRRSRAFRPGRGAAPRRRLRIGRSLGAGLARLDRRGHPPKEAPSWDTGSLADEIKYIGPLVTVAGIVVLSGGPMAAGIAALVAAGLGGAALKEILDDELTTSHSGGIRSGASSRRRAALGPLRR